VQALALALHELATNALKYGAFDTSRGHLSVTWQVLRNNETTPRLALEWVEAGLEIPRALAANPPRGYGRELIENALPYQLDATTSFNLGEDGVRCLIELPLTRRGPPTQALRAS
jgi:two-component system CheB/CheR fusion protein